MVAFNDYTKVHLKLVHVEALHMGVVGTSPTKEILSWKRVSMFQMVPKCLKDLYSFIVPWFLWCKSQTSLVKLVHSFELIVFLFY